MNHMPTILGRTCTCEVLGSITIRAGPLKLIGMVDAMRPITGP